MADHSAAKKVEYMTGDGPFAVVGVGGVVPQQLKEKRKGDKNLTKRNVPKIILI